MIATVLFGAFDRHNLGDLLLARVAEAEAPGPVVCAGLAARDMTPHGGPRVRPLADVADRPVRLVHVGGEILDCDDTQAAYMLGEPGLRWGRLAPYVVPKGMLPAGSTVEFRAVGGAALAERPAAFRHEVLAALSTADAVTVRDRMTQACLAAAGIAAAVVSDPVSRIADLWGDTIRARRPVAGDYLAVQFAAEWGDDATLAALARGLDQCGLPVVLFRAGAAPWHDDLEPYGRLAARLAVPCRIFGSLHVDDLCALIAHARGYVGTSLHGRIVADAFAVPATSLEQAPGRAAKLRAYLGTWQPRAMPVALADFAA